MPNSDEVHFESKHPFRILCLDGGGSKGVYTLGILNEVEAVIGKPLSEHFDLIYGTSTGAIITAMLGLGLSITAIKKHYFSLIPVVMKHKRSADRSRELRAQAVSIFGEKKFDSFLTRVGIVAANYELERPLIFKTSVGQAFGRQATFSPGFGCTIVDALLASAAAYPLFDRVIVETENQGKQELIDGGFVANNPTLFAIADAIGPLSQPASNVKILSLGVGHYKEPQKGFWSHLMFKLPSVELAQKQFAMSTNTVETMRKVFFSNIDCVRVDDSFPDKRYETDLLEHDPDKLATMYGLGSLCASG